MIFYHRTTIGNWESIQKEGVLWGITDNIRYTYLTPDKNIDHGFGEVLLEVEYEPVGIDGTDTDNYGFDPPKGQICWQFSVFVPIPIRNVKRINILDITNIKM
jgi:hypothetical protein